MTRKHTAVAAIVGLLCLTSVPGQATTVFRQSLADLVHKAETIVVGTVSAIQAEWNAETERPYTRVTLIGLDVRKGQTQETLTLRLLGGPTPDGRRLRIAGTPDFRLGDRVVLFVVGNESHAVPLVGMWQGVYRVLFDTERGEDVVYTDAMRPLTRLPTAAGGAMAFDHAPAAPHREAAEPLALDTLLEAIDREVSHE